MTNTVPSDLFNVDIFKQLQEIMQDRFVMLMEDYISESNGLMQKMVDASSAGDANVIGTCAHSLKSSSEQMAALPLSSMMQELENKGKDGDLDGIEELVASASDMHARVSSAMQGFVDASINKKTCLVVDDIKINKEVASEIMKQLGFDVVMTESAMDARTFVESDYVDFILLDWQLPEMDGVEFARSLRQEGNDIPIFLYSAVEGEERMQEALDAGVNAFIPKPTTKQRIKDALEANGLL